MRTIFAEYNPQCNSIDVYTSAGYMLRIDCWETEKDLKTTPGSDCALNTRVVKAGEVVCNIISCTGRNIGSNNCIEILKSPAFS